MENLNNTNHGQIKINGITFNRDLKQIQLNAEMVSNFHDETYQCYEDKENMFSYHIKPSNSKNHVRVDLRTEDRIEQEVFHKTECREIKAYIDNFLLTEINYRKLN